MAFERVRAPGISRSNNKHYAGRSAQSCEGILIYIAVAVLLIHVALALAHVAIVVASGRSRDAWSTMGEMMVLTASSSAAEQLRNACAGVSKKETWGLVIRVRETSDEHLELVFEENEKGGGQYREQVKPGKKYR